MHKNGKIGRLKFWSSGVQYINFIKITAYSQGENYGNS
jgi:hypothetical protein